MQVIYFKLDFTYTTLYVCPSLDVLLVQMIDDRWHCVINSLVMLVYRVLVTERMSNSIYDSTICYYIC